jgi:ornithine decarboxylase
MRRLSAEDIELKMLDLGGGFPAHYGADVPSIGAIGAGIVEALDEHLPYRPELLTAEPGRSIVAESGVLVASVLGRTVRDGENWLYLDVGAYNGLMECLQTAQAWKFPLWTSRADHTSAELDAFTVTGPSCDSSDTMFQEALLPASIGVGDRIYIASAGAYTLSYASMFNGFPLPRSYSIDGLDG